MAFRQVMCAALAAWCGAALADEAIRKLNLGDTTVSLPWSAEWREHSKASGTGSITFGTENPLQLQVILRVAPATVNVSTDQYMQVIVGDMASLIRNQSVEKEFPQHKISGPGARGYYVCATDRAPKPREWEYLCEGILNVGGVPIVFHVFYSDNGKLDARKVMKSLKNLQLETRN